MPFYSERPFVNDLWRALDREELALSHGQPGQQSTFFFESIVDDMPMQLCRLWCDWKIEGTERALNPGYYPELANIVQTYCQRVLELTQIYDPHNTTTIDPTRPKSIYQAWNFRMRHHRGLVVLYLIQYTLIMPSQRDMLPPLCPYGPYTVRRDGMEGLGGRLRSSKNRLQYAEQEPNAAIKFGIILRAWADLIPFACDPAYLDFEICKWCGVYEQQWAVISALATTVAGGIRAQGLKWPEALTNIAKSALSNFAHGPLIGSVKHFNARHLYDLLLQEENAMEPYRVPLSVYDLPKVPPSGSFDYWVHTDCREEVGCRQAVDTLRDVARRRSAFQLKILRLDMWFAERYFKHGWFIPPSAKQHGYSVHIDRHRRARGFLKIRFSRCDMEESNRRLQRSIDLIEEGCKGWEDYNEHVNDWRESWVRFNKHAASWRESWTNPRKPFTPEAQAQKKVDAFFDRFTGFWNFWPMPESREAKTRAAVKCQITAPDPYGMIDPMISLEAVLGKHVVDQMSDDELVQALAWWQGEEV